jgi:phage tail sheath protein FI
MANRTIQSPGVEIRESDLSLRTAQTGTTTYIAGFASEGPTDEVIGLGNISEFEQIYGTPKTPAERYFYHSARAALNSTGSLLVNRLPYGAGNGQGFGSKISVLAYPAIAYDERLDEISTTFSMNSGTYVLGRPTQFELTQEQYIQLKNGELFDWGNDPRGQNTTAAPYTFSELAGLSAAALIVVNKGQTVVDNLFNGYYIGVKDNTLLNPATDFDSIRNVFTVDSAAGATGLSTYITVPTSRLEFQLTATSESGSNPATNSISQVMEDRIVGYNIGGREFDDTLNIGVFKLRQSVFSKEANNLDYLFEEGYNGSIGAYRQRNSENGGAPVNFSLENVEDGSRNIDILVNPNVSNALKGVQLKDNGEPRFKVRVYGQAFNDALSAGEISTDIAGLNSDFFTASATGSDYANFEYADALTPLGSYSDVDLTTKVIGSIPSKLDRALDRIRNDRKFDISMIAEAGLGTINTYMETVSASDANFDDTKTTTAIEALRTSNDLTNTFARSSYMNVFNKFATFAGPVKDGGRGDILFIADPIRQLVVTGKNSKVQKDVTKNFYTDIYWAIRHQFANANTSYATVFANWMSVYDNYSGLQSWVPSSGFAAAKMAATDAAVGPWGAPAGFNRGIITDASDIAVTPNQRQRDDLYTANLNPIANFADQGNVFFGQKTLLRKPSAFDRINVRRTFLYLEKITKKTMQFFLFENNTLFTRTRVVNTLTPFFERTKAADGLYDYMIVCDERNNTAEVIDQNELVVDIYLKPVRTAEFILVNFYATRTDANFEELIGG